MEYGIQYSLNMDRFPSEFKKIYNDEELIPISHSIKKDSKEHENQKHKKIVPLPDLSQKNDMILNSDRQSNMPNPFSQQIHSNRNLTLVNHTTSNDDRDSSNIRTRNRNRFHFSSAIPENEEEGKGTIEFKSSRHPHTFTLNNRRQYSREEIKDRNNESVDPLIYQEDNIEQEIEENVGIESPKSSEESKRNLSEESKHNSPHRNEAEGVKAIDRFEERKRSISAREPTRKLHMNRNTEYQLPMQLQQNNLFKAQSKPSLGMDRNVVNVNSY